MRVDYSTLEGLPNCSTRCLSLIDEKGVLTVKSASNLKSGDIITLTNVQGDFKEVTDEHELELNHQSYFISVIDDTKIQLIRNYNAKNREKLSFRGSCFLATAVYINESNIIELLNETIKLSFPDDLNRHECKMPLHLHLALKIAISKKDGNSLQGIAFEEMNYLGMRIPVLQRFPANTIDISPLIY